MTIRYALDTSVLSETSKENPDLRVMLWIARIHRAVIPMGVITELEQGVHMRATYDVEGAVHLLEWLDALLATGIKIAETNTRVARKYGEMRACKSIRHLDQPDPESDQVGGQDLHIAAAAIEHGLVVATINIRDFLLIHKWFPLPGLYDPKTDHWYVHPGSEQICPLERKRRRRGGTQSPITRESARSFNARIRYQRPQ